MKDIEMIISRKDLEKNRKKHLAADARRIKARKKERIINIIGIGLFYLLIVGGVIFLNARMEQINNNTGATYEVSSIER